MRMASCHATMNIGMYQSAAAMSALERWQDIVTQNITAGQSAGYQKRTVQFSGLPMGEHLVGGRARVGEGQSGVFPKLNVSISFQPGEIQSTKRELDVALQGEGFFVVQAPDGRKIYTRNGELRVRSDRTLSAAGAGEILTEGGTPIQTLQKGGPIAINKDGTVYQGETLLGKLQVVKFQDTSSLVPQGPGYVSNNGTEPVSVEKPEVIQGYLESCNATALREMVDLVTISRAYEANQKLVQSREGTLAKALELLG